MIIYYNFLFISTSIKLYTKPQKKSLLQTSESINSAIGSDGWRNTWNVRMKVVSVASNSIIVLMCNVM